MPNSADGESESSEIAQRWCQSKGSGWSVKSQLGSGGTAPVLELNSPEGLRALKIYDKAFSAGEKGPIELKRIEQQLELRGHNCPFLVQVYEGGMFEDRLFLLMSRVPGNELEKRLPDIPRNRIRQIVDQVTRAALFLHGRKLCHRDIKAANIFISENFDHATLLDISVIRNIYDPVGSGSDQGGQLPVLATARYSPPEYLFRLIEPCPELWHALNIYQLGALMHDLIMRESLFEAEYLKSKENRYRFAWIVATTIPEIAADDVDHDLVFMAHRALDKDWSRRSVLRLEDFLADAQVRQEHALQLLGLGIGSKFFCPDDDIVGKLQRLREVSERLNRDFLQFLTANSITATHEIRPGANDNSKLLVYRWNAPGVGSAIGSHAVQFRLAVKILIRLGGYCFRTSAWLSTAVGGSTRELDMELPEIQDEPGVEVALAKQGQSAFGKLATEIARPIATAKEA